MTKTVLDNRDGVVLHTDSISFEETSLLVDIKDVSIPMELSGLPDSLKTLEIGPHLIKSLTHIDIPMYVETYIGPLFHGTVLPHSLKHLTYVQSFSSVTVDKITIPQGVLSINIVSNDKTFSVDGLKIPNSVKSLRIDGKFNTSLTGLNMRNVDNVILPVAYTQPMVEHIDNSDRIGSMSNSIPTVTGISGIDKLSDHLPSLNFLNIVLGDEIPGIWDAWTNVLFEGLVRVRSLHIDATHVTGNILKDVHSVIDRSITVGRPIAREIEISGLIYHQTYKTSYFKISESLKHVNNMTMRLSHQNTLTDIVPFMARTMGMCENRCNSLGYRVYFSLFCVVSSEIGMKNNTIIIKKGDGPVFEKSECVMDEPINDVFEDYDGEEDDGEEDDDIPDSSFNMMGLDVPFDMSGSTEKTYKPILLYTWTKCGFCKKQEDVNERFMSKSDENRTLFEKMVDVRSVDDPSTIQDDRIKSFPSWVSNDNVEPGVKDTEMIRILLNGIDS